MSTYSYVIYAHDPRDGFTRWEFYDFHNCLMGGEELVKKFPAAGYKIVNRSGRVIRRRNYTG